MSTVPDVRRYWRTARAVESAREAALNAARRELADRKIDTPSTQTAEHHLHPPDTIEPPGQVGLAHHLGYGHLQFFHAQLQPIIEELPAGFRAVEIGAGMGWHAALTAAWGAGRVVATEVAWDRETPWGIGNVHALHRLAEREPRLASTLRFHRNAEGHLTSVEMPRGLSFVRATAERLPLAAGTFDFLYAHNCVEHLKDLAGVFREAERVLRPGGTCFMDSQPLYFSCHGHHLVDIAPVPWGHLLWEPEGFAEIVVREFGLGVEWAPGVPLRKEHVLKVLREELNGASPRDIRKALRGGPWRVRGWVDVVSDEDKDLARGIGLRDALHGIPEEALFLRGIVFRLERRRGWHPSTNAALWLSHSTRRSLRRFLGRNSTAEAQ